jgi:hypothetical protein
VAYHALPQRTRQQEVEASVEVSTNKTEINQREGSAQEEDEAAEEEHGEVEKADLLQESKVDDANEKFEIVGNDTSSSYKDISNWHRAHFED